MDFAIIAAGEGSRLVDEGVSTPKPLVKLNGEAMIDRLIRIFLANGAKSISVIVNNEMETVFAHLKAKTLPIPFHLVRKSTPSSMHSFYELSSILGGGKFCLTTVDTIFREDEFAEYVRAFEASRADGLMAVTDYIDDERPLYVETDEGLSVRSFRDKAYEGSKFVSGGIYCLNHCAIQILQASIEAGISRMRNYQRQLVAQGLDIRAYAFSKIIDVDHQEDIVKAERFLLEIS